MNSGEKATCVIETSSITRLKRKARLVKFSRTSLDTFFAPMIQPLAPHERNVSTHHLSLRNKLAGVKLSNNTFEDLVDNGRQHAFVIIGSQFPIDVGKFRRAGPRQYTAGNVDHLQIWA